MNGAAVKMSFMPGPLTRCDERVLQVLQRLLVVLQRPEGEQLLHQAKPLAGLAGAAEEPVGEGEGKAIQQSALK